ncbi:MAG: Hsp70 family protein [Kofleriaceae bacterium]
MSRELVLGVDFGSSSTIAGVLVGDRIQLVQEQGDPVIPSVVYLPDRGPPEVGHRAVNHQLTEPSKVVRSVKRVLGLPASDELVRRYAASVPFRVDRIAGDRTIFKLRTGDVAPEQIAACILSRVRELGEARFGVTIRRVVLTMSAAAPAGYRDAAMRAAKIAHLEVVEMLAEPIAGALALDLHRQPAKRRIVVCDFGGGTFDVSAVLQNGMSFTPVAAYGDHYLGGNDLDDALAEAISGVIFRSSKYDMHKDVVRWNELLLRCESAKRQLSSRPEAPLAMKDAYVNSGRPKDLQLTLEQHWAETVWTPIMDRVRTVVTELLARAEWRPNTVDVVGLIGGSSLIPMFRRSIGEIFGEHKLLITPDAELAVAQGATLLTARHQSNVSDQIPILLDAS